MGSWPITPSCPAPHATDALGHILLLGTGVLRFGWRLEVTGKSLAVLGSVPASQKLLWSSSFGAEAVLPPVWKPLGGWVRSAAPLPRTAKMLTAWKSLCGRADNFISSFFFLDLLMLTSSGANFFFFFLGAKRGNCLRVWARRGGSAQVPLQPGCEVGAGCRGVAQGSYSWVLILH